jgi:CheY-specific phosphatase CheX
MKNASKKQTGKVTPFVAPKGQEAEQVTPDFVQELPNNVTVEVRDNRLTLTIDLDVTGPLSSSGKTYQVASSNGFFALPTHPGVAINLNVCRKK